MNATISCICANERIVTIGGAKVRCKCGALLWVDKNKTPYVSIPEDSIAERAARNKSVKRFFPLLLNYEKAERVGR